MNESNEKSLSSAVNMSLANLVGVASQQAEPIRAKIIQIKSDIAQLDEGDFTVPALKQAINSLEVAENSTTDKAKEALGLLIVQWCKDNGIVFTSDHGIDTKQSNPRLTPEQKSQAVKAIMVGVAAGQSLSRGDAAKLANITPEQAATVLKKLVADGQLVTQGAGKNTRYVKREPLRTQTQEQILRTQTRDVD